MNTCFYGGCNTKIPDNEAYCSRHKAITFKDLDKNLGTNVFKEDKAIDKQVGGNHYKKHTIQPWHIIDDYELDFYLGNTIKYVLREKGNQLEDLQKAVHYLERKIELLQENPKQGTLDLECDGMHGDSKKFSETH